VLADQVEAGKIRYSFPDPSTTVDRKSYARAVVSVVKKYLGGHSGSRCSFDTEQTCRVEVHVPLREVTS
jgi:hypothetical protein